MTSSSTLVLEREVWSTINVLTICFLFVVHIYLQDMPYINAVRNMRVGTSFTGIDWCKALHLCVPIWIISLLYCFFIWKMCLKRPVICIFEAWHFHMLSLICSLTPWNFDSTMTVSLDHLQFKTIVLHCHVCLCEEVSWTQCLRDNKCDCGCILTQTIALKRCCGKIVQFSV